MQLLPFRVRYSTFTTMLERRRGNRLDDSTAQLKYPSTMLIKKPKRPSSNSNISNLMNRALNNSHQDWLFVVNLFEFMEDRKIMLQSKTQNVYFWQLQFVVQSLAEYVWEMRAIFVRLQKIVFQLRALIVECPCCIKSEEVHQRNLGKVSKAKEDDWNNFLFNLLFSFESYLR